ELGFVEALAEVGEEEDVGIGVGTGSGHGGILPLRGPAGGAGNEGKDDRHTPVIGPCRAP
ncbi:MAG: hypothetical protein AAGK78_02310, partial [Planctomycetota bacterium]